VDTAYWKKITRCKGIREIDLRRNPNMREDKREMERLRESVETAIDGGSNMYLFWSLFNDHL
jgi:hypothetical protein